MTGGEEERVSQGLRMLFPDTGAGSMGIVTL